MEHRVSNCPERKSTVQLVDNKEDYVRYFKFSCESNFNCEFSLECLMDSGSVISFVRRSRILNYTNFKNFLCSDGVFFGINGSKLNVCGKLNCYVAVGDRVICMDILVMSDDTMSYECVLGRDFLAKAGFRLVSCQVGSDLCEDDFGKLILSIDVGDNCDFDLVVGESIGHDDKCKLSRVYNDYYVRPIRPLNPKVYCEIKLRLSEDKCFNCCPRRLSYKNC